MKGLIISILSLVIMMSAANANAIKAQDLVAIKLKSNEIIKHLSLQESTKVLKSLDEDENIEIRDRVIYPEEIAQLITKKLTKSGKSGKRPNQNDYN